MTIKSWGIADGISTALTIAVCVVTLLWILFLAFELRHRERTGTGRAIALTGILGALLLLAAALRPVRVATKGTWIGPRVVVLVDQSRRLLLPSEKFTRYELALETARGVTKHFSDARINVLGFAEGEPKVIALDKGDAKAALLNHSESDLVAAISSLAQSPGERPKAVVIVSDGRLSRPSAVARAEDLGGAVSALGVPLHTVSVLQDPPPDASIRSIKAAGAAVAHQPLALTVEIGCSGGLKCEDIPVVAKELRAGVDAAVLASGSAKMNGETATVELTITLERAGARVVEISIATPQGDTIVENDTRILTFSVARERVRLLHVAGRPTYDVRALRMWLKSDESVDVVAFFILRTNQDNPQTMDDSELALIPFPVDELFTQHLPSFDAVVLQDIDAVEYHLERHLPALASYVKAGGGLIMVGGPSAFSGGGYYGSPIQAVLPVEMGPPDKPFDTADFIPRYTEAGRVAPVLRGLRELFGEELPSLAGSNSLGPSRDGSIVLLEHPDRRAASEAMPILALGESGDGRSIALAVDGTHQLAFSEFAEKAAGRAYGALWDGLLGWLMRDPRYEAARIELVGECFAGTPTTLRLSRLPGTEGEVELSLERLSVRGQKPMVKKLKAPPSGTIDIDVGALEVGGYTARARIGKAPPTRYDFACEKGGSAWSDSRPDPERLKQIASATGGRAVTRSNIEDLPLPQATEIAAERKTTPLLPTWAWTLSAAVALGAHWVLRRRAGLT